jgi:hypothetical protein
MFNEDENIETIYDKSHLEPGEGYRIIAGSEYEVVKPE